MSKRKAVRMQNDKAALHLALASLNSHPKILQIRSALKKGIQSALGLGLHFSYDNMNNALYFDDLYFYLSEDHEKIILAFIYPNSTTPGRLQFPGVDLAFDSLNIGEFSEFLQENNIEFSRYDLNQYVSCINLNGAVFHFDHTNTDRRIDITHLSMATTTQPAVGTD